MKIIHSIKGIVTFFLVMQSLLYADKPIDLEDMAQDFVLETKQIIVPGFPGAFNAAIIRFNGSLLMSFRVRNAKMVSTFEIGLVWLDDDFNPISTPQILEVREKITAVNSQNQDPRLFVINQQLYMIYSGFTEVSDLLTRRMFVAQVHYENEKFYIVDPLRLHPFEDWSKRLEKNWVPFNYNESILVAYSLIPHRIFSPSITGECSTVSSTESVADWNWGVLRGGTPALLDGNEYVAFFHSSKEMVTAHSNGKKIQHYFMGAYTFCAQPPFNITRISSQPIVGKNFYHGADYPTWKPLRVVFPMGCIADEDFFWVSYGRQDFEIWVAKIDKKGLYNSLTPCKRKIKKGLEVEPTSVLEAEINESENPEDQPHLV